MFSDSLILAFVLFLVRFIADEAAFQKAKRTGSGFRFPVGIGLRIVFRLGGPFLIFAGYMVQRQSSGNLAWMLAALSALMGFACIFGEPGEIVTSPRGIKQKNYLGLKNRVISWERAAARYVPAMREVLVIGRDGIAITHSRYHVGQDQFIQELKRHQVFMQGATAQ
jgi:hypothetical protein